TRYARAHRRHLGGQVRSARGIPELPDHAAHVSLGRLLLDPLAAAVLAIAVARQPVLLYDRRLPLRIFRLVRRAARAEPRDRRGLRVPAVDRDTGDPPQRLEAAPLNECDAKGVRGAGDGRNIGVAPFASTAPARPPEGRWQPPPLREAKRSKLGGT